MAILGYLRVSTNGQHTENQKIGILNYANNHKLTIDQWIECKVSSRKSSKERLIDQLLNRTIKDDTLIVAELSRLGRSVGQIIVLLDTLVNKGIQVISIKENLKLDNKSTIQSKIMVTLLSLFAEIEQDLISARTKEGLERAKAEGKTLGRPKGRLSKSKLDGKQEEIQHYINKGVTRNNIAKIFNVSFPTLENFIQTRGLSKKRLTKVRLWLRVERNNRYVRGMKKTREEIEHYVLMQYDMKKSEPDDWEYELSIPYKNDKELDDTIYDIIGEMSSIADMRNCFIETDVEEIGSDKIW